MPDGVDQDIGQCREGGREGQGADEQGLADLAQRRDPLRPSAERLRWRLNGGRLPGEHGGRVNVVDRLVEHLAADPPGGVVDRAEGRRGIDEGGNHRGRDVGAKQHGRCGRERDLRDRRDEGEEDPDRRPRGHAPTTHVPQTRVHQRRPEPAQPGVRGQRLAGRHQPAQALVHRAAQRLRRASTSWPRIQGATCIGEVLRGSRGRRMPWSLPMRGSA